MGLKRQNEVQVVVGNKRLLFLFFTAAVSFSLFFFWGYTIGYGQGASAGPSKPAAWNEIPDPDTEEGMLPRTLLEEPPKVEAVIEPKPPATKIATAKPSAVKSVVKRKTPAPKPAARKPAPKTAGKILHLQVAALRMSKDARALASRLKKRGYAAAVHESPGNGWFRVVVGPFGSDQAAEAVRQKLGKDGFDPMTRRF